MSTKTIKTPSAEPAKIMSKKEFTDAKTAEFKKQKLTATQISSKIDHAWQDYNKALKASSKSKGTNPPDNKK